VANATTLINHQLTINVKKGNSANPIVTHNGVEVLQCLCGHNIWLIEHCTPKLNNCCLMLQKDTEHYYKSKIIFKQIDHGILARYYVGYWSTAKVISIELYKFWSPHDDFMRCVGRTNKKYALDRLALITLWLVQEGTNFTRIEMLALEEVRFFVFEEAKMSPR